MYDASDHVLHINYFDMAVMTCAGTEGCEAAGGAIYAWLCGTQL